MSKIFLKKELHILESKTQEAIFMHLYDTKAVFSKQFFTFHKSKISGTSSPKSMNSSVIDRLIYVCISYTRLNDRQGYLRVIFHYFHPGYDTHIREFLLGISFFCGQCSDDYILPYTLFSISGLFVFITIGSRI